VVTIALTTTTKGEYITESRLDLPNLNISRNLQQDPPMTKEYFDSSIFLNPLATQVTSSVMGYRPRLTFMSGNTALPASSEIPAQSQPTHADADFDHPEIPFALVANVGLIDMDIESGSTEVWLGTHNGTGIQDQDGKHGERASGRIKPHLLEQRREVRPPCQPSVKKGSIVIRDLRLWHGGKPNLSKNIRVMLAMIHFAPWYRYYTLLDLNSMVLANQSVGTEWRLNSLKT
jgi:hypothetical protein